MITDIELALMAGRAYESTREEINRFPTPQGWGIIEHKAKDSGFEAVTFQRGNEIVISFAGTNGPTDVGDNANNASMATGNSCDQLREAALYYCQIKAANPNATITLTGHSLGGGLASLIGIFFNTNAVTFDQAPFRNTAIIGYKYDETYRPVVKDDLLSFLRYNEVSEDLLRPLDEYGAYPGDLERRESSITNQCVQGELLSTSPWTVFNRIGTEKPLLTHGTPDAGSGNLHSMALLTAFLENDDFRQITTKLPDLLRMVFDDKLYNFATSLPETKENFIDRLVRHESGIAPGAVDSDMLTRFTDDLEKIAREDGLTMTNNNLTKALIAFAMQAYYNNRLTADATLFDKQGVTGGLHFDRTDVADTLSEMKGYENIPGGTQYFKNYLETLPAEDRPFIEALLPNLLDWFIQAGAGGMSATAGAQAAFMLGGSGSDTLTGGSQADVLIGNNGADILSGGGSYDYLFGGADVDTYIINSGDGNDTIVDEGRNILKINGEIFAGIFTKVEGSNSYVYTSGAQTYTLTFGSSGSSTLSIDGSTSINFLNQTSAADFTDHDFGISLREAAPEPNMPSITGITVNGDLQPWEFEGGHGHIYFKYDQYGNIITTSTAAPDRNDRLWGSLGNDHLLGKGGDDILGSDEGDDLLEGGAGSDLIFGGSGSDLLIANVFGDLALLKTQGETGVGSGQRGDLLSGEKGNDVIYGFTGNDLISGGAGVDYIYGGAGDDDILGDKEIVSAWQDWYVDREVTISPTRTTYYSTYFNLDYQIPTLDNQAGDYIYGGSGNDWIHGLGGDDFIDAGSDNDVVFGEGGNDTILGKSGNDNLIGDNLSTPLQEHGDDYIDGGEGDDYIEGGGGQDTLLGGSGNDILSGEDTLSLAVGYGDDFLDGGAGNDILIGAGGNDTLFGGIGNDTLHGDSDDTPIEAQGDDYIDGGDGDDDIRGLGGADTLSGGVGIDTLRGGAGNDTLFGNEGDDALLGDTENDTLFGGDGKDVLQGGTGNDYLDGNKESDTLLGQDGADTLIGGSGNDYLDGGTGNDIYEFQEGDGADYVNDNQGQNLFKFTTSLPLDDILFSWATQSGDSITADPNGAGLWVGYSAGDVAFIANARSASNYTIEVNGSLVDASYILETLGQELTGTSGADTLTGGRGSDHLYGGDGNDTLAGAGNNDFLYGQGGDDLLIGNAGADTIDGGVGIDTVSYADSTAGIALSLINGLGSGGTAKGDIVTTCENIIGSPYDDVIIGNDDVNILTGGAGRDFIDGAAGADTMIGGQGNDSFIVDNTGDVLIENVGEGEDIVQASVTYALGSNIENLTLTGSNAIDGTGNDLNNLIQGNNYANILTGGAGNDTISGQAGNDTISGGGDNDTLYGGTGADVLNGGTGDDAVYGDTGNDIIYGEDGIDTLYGGEDIDELFGGGGNDVLGGGTGNDQLRGQSGSDTLTGGGGTDYLYGGADDDRYVFTNSYGELDFITDYEGINILQIDSVKNLKDLGYLDFKYVEIDSGSYTENIEGNDLLVGDSILIHEGASLQNVAFHVSENIKDLHPTHIYGQGDDIIQGTEANDVIFSGSGNDKIMTGIGDDTIFAGDGDDVISGDEGKDYLHGGDGIDLVDYSDSETGVNIDLNQTTQSSGAVMGDTYVSIEGVIGSDYDDIIIGDEDISNRLYGGDGNDMLCGGSCDDYLHGGNGDDTLYGRDSNDTLIGGAGADILDGGTGRDTVDYSDSSMGIMVNLGEGNGSGGDAIGDQLINIENIIGSQFDDTLKGGNEIYGHDGNDIIEGAYLIVDGSWGPNYLDGGNGNDIITGATGNDIIHGGVGNDIITTSSIYDSNRLSGDEGNDIFYVHGFRDQVDGGEGIDTIDYSAVDDNTDYWLRGPLSLDMKNNWYVQSVENIIGTSFGDSISGDSGNNIFWGNGGSDNLAGGEGADILYGGEGNDMLSDAAGNDLTDVSIDTFYGDNGDDYIIGSGGIDTLFGGDDNDTLYASNDGDMLYGEDGNDWLYGGAGSDILEGGKGNDHLIGSSSYSDVIEGYDTYIFSQGDGIDIIEGKNSHNILNFKLVSLDEIEISVPDGTNDLVIKYSNFDQVTIIDGNISDNFSFIVEDVTYSCDEFINIKQYANNQTGSDTADILVGDSKNNILTGLAGNDTLTGNEGNDILDGGVGADTMVGGLGNDTYVVDNIGDIVTEKANEGTDTILSSITYTLGSNIENLTLTGGSTINGTGNSLNNVLIGNSSANTLRGGTGADTMSGGLGDDIYIVDNNEDVVVENVGGGADLVQSSVTHTLFDFVENLKLTGTTAINGTGNVLDNIILGNSNTNTLMGGAGNDTLNGGSGSDTMLGGVGDDTYIVDNTSDVVIENASEGTDTVQSNITYTLGDNVENLTLTGTDTKNGTGNALNNILTGNTGANFLNGDAGADTMVGGLGNDTYVVDDTADIVTENASQGTDTVQSSITYTLGLNVENLTLTGTAAINATGNALNNKLIGNTEDNVLNGVAGSDTMVGGLGNDTYIVDNTRDVVTESAREGTDLVQASVTYTLVANIEDLTLTGSSAINGTGNTLNNTLTGNSANNILSGGSGADTMLGGVGDDTYIVDNTSDVVIENASEGTDTVQSNITYTLGDNVENLTLTGTGTKNGTGNALNNILTGNTGANFLNGDAGADTMVGGLGNDTYVVDDTADIVTENASQGTDSVQSSVTYTLSANIENLTLTGSSAINGTGNTLNNTLTGNSANNLLSGGSGADTMLGGVGDDTYIVDNTGDVVTESASEGTDSVQSSVTCTLGSNVENLTLTGSSAIIGTGNTLDNMLLGNSGANTLSGGSGSDTLNGGIGNDILSGGTGNDVFVFNSALNASTNKDTLSDFTVGQDTIQLSNSIFTVLQATGALDSGLFAANTTGTAADSNDYFLYNTTSGVLLYDADGNGQGVAVQFATLTTKPQITANDFLVAA